jgi:lipopolysaccharide export system permease protein
MIKSIDLYLLRQIAPTLAVTIFIAAVILLMERLMRLLDIAVGNGVSTLVVFQMLLYLIPHYIGLALPIALFLGVLLAFRRMSLQSELDAIHSCGIGIGRFIRWAVVLAGILMTLNLALTGYIQPYTRYAFRVIEFNITSGVIEQGIGEGVFMDLPNGYTLRVEQSRGAGRELYGVFAHMQEDTGHITTLAARRGELLPGALDGTVALRLYDGNRSEWDPETKQTKTLQFAVMDWPLNLADLVRFRGRGGDERELTIMELLSAYSANLAAGISNLTTAPNGATDAQPEELVTPAAVASEFHFRVVFSLSMLFLPLLAAPFGIMAHRSSKSFGLVVGLLTLVSYHKVLEFTEAYAQNTGAPAGILLWSIFAVFALATTYLFVRTGLQAGAPPVQRLEVLWIGMVDRIGSVFRFKRTAHHTRSA